MKLNQFVFSIDGDGTITTIYDDAHAALCEEGRATVTRASHVEPHPDGGWTATIISDGTVLGPFPLRKDALAAEIAYITNKLKNGERL